MADLTAAATTLTVDTRTAQHANQIPASVGLTAGEALLTCAPCRIHSDGKVYMSNGTAADAEAQVDGFTGKAYASGDAVTLWGRGCIFEYGTGLTPGATYYVSTTDGRLSDAATTGDATGVARAVSSTHIRIIRDS